MIISATIASCLSEATCVTTPPCRKNEQLPSNYAKYGQVRKYLHSKALHRPSTKRGNSTAVKETRTSQLREASQLQLPPREVWRANPIQLKIFDKRTKCARCGTEADWARTVEPATWQWPPGELNHRDAISKPRQTTGPPQSGAGVGVGVLRGAGDSLT